MFWVGFLSDDRLTWRGPDRGEFQSGEMSRQRKGQGMGGSKHGTGPSRETSKHGRGPSWGREGTKTEEGSRQGVAQVGKRSRQGIDPRGVKLGARKGAI